MPTILRTARGLQAILAPLMGTRATGTVRFVASGADVSLPQGTFAVPLFTGQPVPRRLVKVDAGPNTDGSWTVTAAGTAVTCTALLGGAHANLPVSTEVRVDPPTLTGLASAAVSVAFTGGVDATGWGALRDVVLADELQPMDAALDLRRAGVAGFPAAVIEWAGAELADGTNADMTIRRTRGSRVEVLYADTWTISVIVSRAEGAMQRRGEAWDLVEAIAALLTDTRAVDGESISSPAGIEVGRLVRETGPHPIYQTFAVYTVEVRTMTARMRLDDRTWNTWQKTVLGVELIQDPAVPGQGNLPVVADVEIDMTP